MADEDEELGVETSFEELAKRAEGAVDEEEDGAVLDLGPDDDKAEAFGVDKVIPAQANEFTCRNCFLVKHRSQLADRKRIICLDCA